MCDGTKPDPTERRLDATEVAPALKVPLTAVAPACAADVPEVNTCPTAAVVACAPEFRVDPTADTVEPARLAVAVTALLPTDPTAATDSPTLELMALRVFETLSLAIEAVSLADGVVDLTVVFGGAVGSSSGGASSLGGAA